MNQQTSWDKCKSTDLSHLPKSLVDEIKCFSIIQFEELYETPTSPITLKRACNRILLQLSYDQIKFMCNILAKAVLPTLGRITINLTEFQEKVSYGDQAIDKALLVLLELQKNKFRLTKLT